MNSSQLGREGSQPKRADLISLNEAAELSGLSTGHLRHLLRQDEIWGKKMGRDWFTTEKAVREYLSRNIKPGPKPSKKVS
jgi:hypothetical protein